MRTEIEIERAYDTLLEKLRQKYASVHTMDAGLRSLDAKCQTLGWALGEYDELDEED